MIWFRNVCAYTFTEESTDLLDALEQGLPRYALQGCGVHEPLALGFVAAVNADITPEQLLLRTAGGGGLMCFAQEKRLLPSSVINEIVDERRRELEQREARAIRAREKRELKEQIIQELMPRAFIQRRRTRIYTAPAEGMLWIDTGTARQADEVIGVLRKAVDHFPLSPLTANVDPSQLMNAWVLGTESLPNGWQLGESAVLEDAEGATLRVRNYGLGCDEIRAHLNSGMSVVQLAIQWNDKLDFTLHRDLSLRAMRYSDALQGQVEEEAEGDALTQVHSELALMQAELTVLTQEIQTLFKG